MFDDKLLIIGNGFDIDLGLNTGYKDYVNSQYFKSGLNKNALFDFINSSFNNNNRKWIDVENVLLEYAKNRLVKNGNEAIMNFQELRCSLMAYLKNMDLQSKLNPDSVAARLLRKVLDDGYFNILSFNYTNLNEIVFCLGIKKITNYIHVHGSLLNNSIIVGFQDDVDVLPSKYFMIKSHSPYYRSCNVRERLEKADEIIIFGHSLGSTDYHYFSDFFKKQSGLTSGQINSKKIRIFTYDENSRLEILSQLREMNERRVNYLYDLNDFRIFKTSSPEDKEEIDTYLNELNDFKPQYIQIR